MRRWKGIACALSATVLFGGCAPAVTRSEATPIPRGAAEDGPAWASDPVERLIAYAERVRSAPPLSLEAEYLAVREAYQRMPDSLTRLKLGLLIATPRAPFRDDVRARELLNAAAKDAAATGTARALATLWLRELEERATLERALEDERRQRQVLQRKVEQLKTIEEEIDRRRTEPVVPSQ